MVFGSKSSRRSDKTSRFSTVSRWISLCECSATVCGSRSANTGSISTAVTVAPRSSNASVSDPSPGPTSITESDRPTPEVETTRRTVLASWTKFWPSDLRGRNSSSLASRLISVRPSSRMVSGHPLFRCTLATRPTPGARGSPRQWRSAPRGWRGRRGAHTAARRWPPRCPGRIARHRRYPLPVLIAQFPPASQPAMASQIDPSLTGGTSVPGLVPTRSTASRAGVITVLATGSRPVSTPLTVATANVTSCSPGVPGSSTICRLMFISGSSMRREFGGSGARWVTRSMRLRVTWICIPSTIGAVAAGQRPGRRRAAEYPRRSACPRQWAPPGAPCAPRRRR